MEFSVLFKKKFYYFLKLNLKKITKNVGILEIFSLKKGPPPRLAAVLNFIFYLL